MAIQQISRGKCQCRERCARGWRGQRDARLTIRGQNCVGTIGRREIHNMFFANATYETRVEASILRASCLQARAFRLDVYERLTLSARLGAEDPEDTGEREKSLFCGLANWLRCTRTAVRGLFGGREPNIAGATKGLCPTRLWSVCDAYFRLTIR